ncbi:MAG: redoxin domain-containing protein [Chitinophagales bacterium]
MFRILNISLLLAAFVFFIPTSSKPPSLAIGQKAPEITLPNQSGKVIKLSNVTKGRLTLVDFWSTWCVACNIIKNPEYVRLYNKYKDFSFTNASEFNMFSVAFDSDLNKWKRKIKEQNLDWPYHVVDKDSYYSKYWQIYNMQSIPSSFLLDENGRILGINMSYEQLDKELTRRKRGKKTTTSPPVQPPKPPVTQPVAPPKPTPPPKEVVTNPIVSPTSSANNANKIYKIQLGVFRTPNFNKFKNLNDLGKLEAEKATSKLNRVLLGAFTKQQSKGTLQTVKRRGYNDAFLVVRKPTNTPPSSPPPAAVVTKPKKPQNTPPASGSLQTVYKVQIGVFRQVNLNKFSSLRSIGNIKIEPTSNGLNRILVGSFPNKTNANSALAKIKSKGFDGFIVTRKESEAVAFMSVADTTRQSYETIEQIELMFDIEFSALKSSMLNKTPPEILLRNHKGAFLPLSSQKGKVTLVYFWASWSSLARQTHGDLNKLYEKYAGKDFEIYSVAFDNQEARWKQVIEEDNLNWNIHVRDENGTESDLLGLYQVEYLPAMFLIDKNGKIVSENIPYNDLDVEIDRLLKK